MIRSEAILLSAVLACSVTSAATIQWGNLGTDFAAGTNWVGGTAPADDLITDQAVLTGTPSQQPNLASDRSLSAISFQSGGWNLGGAGVLSLGSGAGGANSLEITGSGRTVTIGAGLNIASSQTWRPGQNTLVLNGPLSGSSPLLLTSNGTWTAPGAVRLSSGSSSYSGTLTNGGHRLEIAGDGVLSGALVKQSSNAWGGADPVLVAYGAARQLAARWDGNLILDGTNDPTITGNSAFADANFQPLIRNSTPAKLTISGTIAGSIKVHTLEGSGTIQIAGSSSNTGMNQNNNDGLVVNVTLLELNKNAGSNVSGGNLTVKAGKVARWLNSDQLLDAGRIRLDGGTLDLNGQFETTGVLELRGNVNSTISFGDHGSIAFAGSSTASWGTSTLTISGFALAQDSLRFGTSAAGLTQAQLDSIRFTDYGNVSAQIDGSGYLSPVPEPGLLAGLAVGSSLLSLRRRSRLA